MQVLQQIIHIFPNIGSFILSLIFVLALLWLLFCDLYFYMRILFYKSHAKPESVQKANTPPVSVVICAKNESEQLTNYLPKILEQKYPQFEVIVVNDCSSDDTAVILYHLKAKYPHLYVTTINEDQQFEHGKKLALTIGIKAAKYEHLLLTDADCYPSSENWISEMMTGFEADTKVVLGYGGYEKQASWINKLIRYDGLSIAFRYMVFALAGKPYMGVGRNLAYKKSFFTQNKGFAKHWYVNSGDDDLFVNNYSTAQNTRVVLQANAHTISPAKESVKSWILQKARHVSTSPHYKFRDKFWLISEQIAKFLFYSIFPVLLILNVFLPIVAGVWLLRTIFFISLYRVAAKIFQAKDLLPWALIFDIILPIFYFKIFIKYLFIRKRKKWK